MQKKVVPMEHRWGVLSVSRCPSAPAWWLFKHDFNPDKAPCERTDRPGERLISLESIVKSAGERE